MRTRNETRWNVPFQRYASLAQFLTSPVTPGGHTIQCGTREVDLLIEDRGADCTLVVFNGAIPLNVQSLPYFTGRGLAAELGVNLIAVSDPVMIHRDLTVAWYLGDTELGPLKPLLVPALAHALTGLSAARTVFFGASGGGYAAAHVAHDFPGSRVVLVNPRLTLERRASDKLAAYLRAAHDVESSGRVTAQMRELLAPYGPTDLAALARNGLNHDVLIYQNVLDASFLHHQFLPFIQAVGHDPRCHIRLANDGAGHVPIPPDTVRAMLRALATQPAIRDAGFAPAAQLDRALQPWLPDLTGHLDALAKQHRALGRERDALQVEQEKLRTEVTRLRQTADGLDARIGQLNTKVQRLIVEPPWWRRVWHVIPRRIRERFRLR